MFIRSRQTWTCIVVTAATVIMGFGLRGEQPTAKQTAAGPQQQSRPATADQKTASDDPNIVYLTKEHDLWIDKKQKQIVMKGTVAVREGNLEMFACPQQSKEYESIVAVAPRDMSAVHAALLALGAKAGHPARFNEKFIPADGTKIDVKVRWTDKQGKRQESPAQDWIRNMKTGKAA